MSPEPGRIAFDLADMPALRGRSFAGDWFLLEQEKIKEFDSSTYVDDSKAEYSFTDYPADENGFLMFEGLHTLGMLLPMVETGLHVKDRGVTGLVYGLDRVRFTAPVMAGERLRAVGEVTDVTPRHEGHLLRVECTVEAQGRERPAYVATLLLLFYPQGGIELSGEDGGTG